MSNRQITGRDTSTNFRFIDCKDRMWACYREGNRFVLDHSAMVDDHEVQRFLNMAEGLPLVEDSGVENRWYVGGRGRRRAWNIGTV